ncbi:MAG: polysaccharide biosynthesis/export family protein [Desulfocurvibacter africanus]
MKSMIVTLILSATLALMSCARPSEQLNLEMSEGESWKVVANVSNRLMPGDELQVLYVLKATDAKDFVIAPLDQVEVKFPTNPELNEIQTVRPDGFITLPFVGDIVVAGRSPKQVSGELTTRYGEYLNVPDVYVIVREYGSRVAEMNEAMVRNRGGQGRPIQVRPDGSASFPIIGDVRAAGQSLEDVRQEVRARYREVDPRMLVDVSLMQAAGAQTWVLGAVTNPGNYPVQGQISLPQALNMAGGIRSMSFPDVFFVVRRDGGVIRYRLLNANLSQPEVQTLMLSEQSIVYVATRTISDPGAMAEQLAQQVFFRSFASADGK